ncbi:hypothetical protein G6F35_004251 [Rhizopus arrhizus]|nr:hypothetical protein G6F35_004251 [Rhizopus arrhizus]
MQSKLFVLRLLSACMQHHRHYYCEQERRKRPEIPSNELILQLPPLDAPLVTFVLVLMSRYITQYHLIEESNSESTPQQIYDYDNTKYSYEQIKLSLITEIYKASAKILHYVSSSNWNECYAKIKHAVLSLGSIKKILDDIPPEIRMLECICLNKERLQLVFKELNPYYLHMRQQGRLLFSKLIRKAIWRWIESYPNEFAQVFTTAPLLDSEQLFDMCNSTADSSKNKSVLWPLQTILLVLSPESLMQAFNGQSSNRRASFLGLLKKSLKNAKNIDLISVCYVDICKAATYVPPETESILRMIAADVEKDLRDKVWDFTQLINIESTVSTLGYTIDQQTLVADFLLSRIRLDKNNTIKALVPSCIDLNSPITAKLALVKSCLAILLEENHLPWNPTLESLYDGLCAPLRTLMLQTIQIEMDSKKKEDTITNHTSRVELLVDMFRLYRIDPLFALLGEGNRVEQNGLLMNGLAVSLVHPVQVIRQSAAELLIKLHRLEYVSHWTSDPNNMHDFWKVSSPTIAVISQRILDTSLNEEMQKFLLDTTIKLLKTRSVFLKHKQALFTSESCNTRERLQAHVSLEIALLISSCSAHKSVCDEASACIAALCQESKIIDVWDEGLNNLSIASDLEVYESFSAENYQFVGRKAQQKRFRKCLQTLFHHTPSCFAAWEEAWMRWEMLTPFVNKVQEDNEENINEGVNGSNKKFPLVGKNDKLKNNIAPMTLVSSKSQQNQDNYEERSVEWHNFTGFLAALGGCCLTRERELDEVVSLSSDNSKRTNNRPLVMIEGFIAKMTKMLVSDNVYVREGIKDILGNDLSPALLAILFRHLEHQMNKCFDFNGKAIRNPQNKLFVEQSILVLRLILDRLGNPSDCLLNIDFSTLMRQFINYLDGVPNTVITLRIKIKMCMLVEVLMQKKERIIIQDGIALRNRILEILVEWTSDVALLRKPLEGGPQVERLQLDLDLACLKTIVKVLHELPLQLLDSVRVHDYRYKRTERNIAANRSTVDSRDSISNSTAGSYQYVSQMKELTILAMSHLLSANVEAGLKYSLSMGYDDDEKTRTSFMEVLKNILEHGTGFEMLSESATTDRYEKLIDVTIF